MLKCIDNNLVTIFFLYQAIIHWIRSFTALQLVLENMESKIKITLLQVASGLINNNIYLYLSKKMRATLE
jgi:hypothetical protein